MTPSLTEEAQLSSYKFEDADDSVIVHLYANGAVEIKEVEVNCDSDALEVITPSNSTKYLNRMDLVFVFRWPKVEISIVCTYLRGSNRN